MRATMMVAAAAAALVLAGCGESDTTAAMHDMWDDSTDNQKGWMCILYRADKDAEMGPDAVVDGIVEKGPSMEPADVHAFLDETCPSRAEVREQLQE